MYKVETTKTFEKDLKRCQKRGLPMDEIRRVISILSIDGTLPAQYYPHKLSGNLSGIWECHIKPNWLMTWQQFDQEFRLLMLRTGTHSVLF